MVKPRESQDQFQMFGSLLRTRDSSIYTEILESEEQTSLRIHRSWQPQPGGVPSLSPPIFLLLSWKSSSQLSLSTLTYNEETICSRLLQGSALCTEAEVRDVISVLQEPCTPCSGLGDTIQNANVSCILIERFGARIYYRSRDCTRIIKPSLYPGKSPDDICTSCLRLVSPELSMENKINHIPEELNMYPDLSVYQGEEEEMEHQEKEKEETKNSVKNSKIKVLQEQPGSFVWEETPEKKPEVSYVCPEVGCKRRFRRKKTLEKHLTEAHKGNGLIRCPVPSCKRTFREVGRKLAVHINKIHPDKEIPTKLSAPELRCKVCEERFTSLTDLRVHESSCKQPATCELCGQVCVSSSTLKVHKRNIHSDEWFVCPEPNCDRKVKTKASLLDHISSVHKNEKLYVCHGCGKDFRYRHQRRMCENKHMGKFIHPCNLCDKKFNDKRRFEQHMRVHTGEKPFACPICSFRCSRLDNLNLHTKKSHGVTWKEAEGMTGVSCRSKTDHDPLALPPVYNIIPVDRGQDELQHFNLLLEPVKTEPYKILASTTNL